MDYWEKIKNKIIRKQPPKIIYPLNKIEVWDKLRNKYNSTGYTWLELDLNTSKKEIKKIDKKNYRKFLEMKNHEQSLKRSSMVSNIPIILPPPKPNHLDRYTLLKKWNRDDFFNVSMVTSELQEKYNLRPVTDYDPANVFDIYFEKISSSEEDFDYITPSAPPPVISSTTIECLPPYDFEI